MNEEEPLALEMLRELKRKSEQEERNAIRWFRLALLELLAIVIIIGAFIWYINQPIDTVEDVSYSQDANTQGENSNISQNAGE